MIVTLFANDLAPVEAIVSLPSGWEKLPSETFPHQPKDVEVLRFAPVPREPHANGSPKTPRCPIICIGFRRVAGVGVFLYPGYTTKGLAENSPETDLLIGRAKPKHLPLDAQNQIILQLH